MNQSDVTGSAGQDLDIWHVRLSNGETRRLSLDELDAGFNEGWITEHTPVLAAGAFVWKPLSEVAGLDETPPPAPSVPNSIAPLALDNFGLDSRAGSVPFDIDVPMDAESNAEVAAFRPRRGKRLLGFMTVMVLLGGLGFAGLRARPGVQKALAARAEARSDQSAAAAAAAPPAIAAPPAPAPAPQSSATTATPALPTSSVTSLPNAPATAADKAAEKKAAAEAAKAAKRGAAKRAK